jgi:hypothetical protein
MERKLEKRVYENPNIQTVIIFTGRLRCWGFSQASRCPHLSIGADAQVS